MLKVRLLFLVTVFCFLGFIFCYATPTTHIWAPSVEVQPYKKWHLTSDFYFPIEKDKQGERPNTITNVGLTVGVLSSNILQLELGFDHKSGLDELDDYPIYFNAKLGIPENVISRFIPALAVGIYDVGTKNDKTNYNILYVKTAKSFFVNDISLGKLSFGYFYGNSKLLLDRNNNKDNNDIFWAWERTLSEITDKLWVCVEYMGTESSYGSWNFGFSYKLDQNICVLFGYDVYNNKDLADTVTFQIDIDF